MADEEERPVPPDDDNASPDTDTGAQANGEGHTNTRYSLHTKCQASAKVSFQEAIDNPANQKSYMPNTNIGANMHQLPRYDDKNNIKPG